MNINLYNKIIFFRDLGLENWIITSNRMNNFVNFRNCYTFDEIWFVEHYPIFTEGQSKNITNLNYIKKIPVVSSNRGGKITYHGPGQQVLYFLIDLRRRNVNIRQLIDIMEKAVILTLKKFSIEGYVKEKSPGIYINNRKKICSLGLRVKKGFTLHGLSINVNMNLIPFSYIAPCGDTDIKMTQIKDFYQNITIEEIKKILIQILSQLFHVEMINLGKI